MGSPRFITQEREELVRHLITVFKQFPKAADTKTKQNEIQEQQQQMFTGPVA